MSDELQELQERAEHAAHNPSLAPVSLTMAILAVAVAVVTLLSHRAHTEEVVLQSRANDQWAFYQAKNIRLHADRKFADLAEFVTATDYAKLAKAKEASLAEAEKYEKQTDEIQNEAKQLEAETDHERRRANRFDLGEVCLEIGLVITSITLLSGKRAFWHSGILLGLAGAATAATALFVR
jgi:DNA gyrase/topoisomerase IV subunit A